MNAIHHLMQKRFSKHVLLLSIVCWAALAIAPRTPAQTPPGLNLQLYAGLSITGAVGTVCAVEYVTDLAQTNSWRCLEFLQLLASPYLWADKSAPATGRRFCRAGIFAAWFPGCPGPRPALSRRSSIASIDVTIPHN